jgi:uncharacterized phiE125 gp8 family phage protein
MKLAVVTPPAEEPIPLELAKKQARVDHAHEDDLISLYIATAREKCEELTRRALAVQTLKFSLASFPQESYIRVPRPPLISIDGITYVDDDGIEHTMSAADYLADTEGDPGRVVLKSGVSWPTDSLLSGDAVRITYQAGYAPEALPKTYQAAMLMLISHLYEQREASVEAALSEIPFGVTALCLSNRGWY